MRYIHFETPGPPDILQLKTGPAPHVGPNDIGITTKFAGINRADLLQRAGNYPLPKGDSPVLGLEVCGKIDTLGENVTGFEIGQQVVALTNGGGYAEYVAVPHGQVLPLPENLDPSQGAALAENAFTAWFFMIERAQLQPGEWILIHGGAGPLGTMAIQFALLMGAKPITTVGTPEGADFCQSLGAQTINYKTQDFVIRVKQITNDHGADVILDPIGGHFIAKNYAAAARFGRIGQISFLDAPKAEANFALLLVKQLTHFGNTLRPQTAQIKASIGQNLRAKIWPMITQQKLLFPPIHTYPLADAARAHADLEGPDKKGKFIFSC